MGKEKIFRFPVFLNTGLRPRLMLFLLVLLPNKDLDLGPRSLNGTGLQVCDITAEEVIGRAQQMAV